MIATFEVACRVSPALRLLLFRLMSLFRILKNQSRHRQASDVPSTSSHSVDSEILVQGADPITAE